MVTEEFFQDDVIVAGIEVTKQWFSPSGHEPMPLLVTQRSNCYSPRVGPHSWTRVPRDQRPKPILLLHHHSYREKKVKKTQVESFLVTCDSEPYLGSTDAAKYKDGLEFHKIDSSYGHWLVPGANSKVGSTTASSDFEKIIDSGTTLTYAPFTAAEAIPSLTGLTRPKVRMTLGNPVEASLPLRRPALANRSTDSGGAGCRAPTEDNYLLAHRIAAAVRATDGTQLLRVLRAGLAAPCQTYVLRTMPLPRTWDSTARVRSGLRRTGAESGAHLCAQLLLKLASIFTCVLLFSHLHRPERARRRLRRARSVNRERTGREGRRGCPRAVIDQSAITPLTHTSDALAAHATRRHRACDSRRGYVLNTVNWVSHIACARLESGADARSIRALRPRLAPFPAHDASTRFAVDTQTACVSPAAQFPTRCPRSSPPDPKPSQQTKIHGHTVHTFPVPARAVPVPIARSQRLEHKDHVSFEPFLCKILNGKIFDGKSGTPVLRVFSEARLRGCLAARQAPPY
ncbi:hypothetical protein C8R45DRAFT_946881 [Mycena sanguinolenta]|nr:hypothetical protein C8R45DRAFT_946881 [Mycena sanguinolenta]